MSSLREKAVDSFGTFLESVKGPARASSEGASLKLLEALESGPLPLPELMKASGMAFERFAEALQSMRKLKLVRMGVQNGDEVAELTPEGEQLAKLAHE